MEILQSPHELTGSQKFKMAAEIFKVYISTCRPDSDAISTTFPLFSRSRKTMTMLQCPHELTGSQKIKLAAENCKPIYLSL